MSHGLKFSLLASVYFKVFQRLKLRWVNNKKNKQRQGTEKNKHRRPFLSIWIGWFLRSVQMVPRPEMTTWSLKDAGASWSGDWLCSWWACALLYQTETDWQHAEVMIISKRMKLSLRCLFTCRGLSGFAGWAWLSVVRICGAVQLSCAHVQK